MLETVKDLWIFARFRLQFHFMLSGQHNVISSYIERLSVKPISKITILKTPVGNKRLSMTSPLRYMPVRVIMQLSCFSNHRQAFYKTGIFNRVLAMSWHFSSVCTQYLLWICTVYPGAILPGVNDVTIKKNTLCSHVENNYEIRPQFCTYRVYISNIWAATTWVNVRLIVPIKSKLEGN